MIVEKKEKVICSHGFFELVDIEEEFVIDGAKKVTNHSFARRSPGIRAIIVDKPNKKILFSKEFRYELNDWDYRLPGGKVFDTLSEYKDSLNRDDVDDCALKAVAKEVLEEVGLVVHNPKLLKISKAGSSVIWDLYYYEITDYKLSEIGTSLFGDEVMDGFVWKSYEEIIRDCINNKIHEDRSVAVLLTYINSVKK